MTASAGILCLNAGSSSLKFAWFEVRDGALDERARFHGQLEGIGSERARWVVHEVRGEVSDGMGASSPGSSPNNATGTSAAATQAALPLTGSLEAQHKAALAQVLAWLEARLGQAQPIAVAHRVVHGGTEYAAPVVVDEAVLAQLEALVPLAPLHQPHNLRPIRWLAQRHPGWRQVACFDTAFHRSQPWQAQMMPLPRALWDAGVRRYGFHGLSYQYVASRLPEVLGERLAQGRVVIAHLGNGASMCALVAGRSVASTMGFTALDGLMMGTRCGAIDPGVVLHLLAQGMSAERVERLLYQESGLLGVSGIASDMRALLASPEPAAAQAVELFCYRAARELGSLAAASGGLDALVFTGGIGEHAVPVRARIAELSAWLGVVLDARANARAIGVTARLEAPDSRVAVAVVPTNEEAMMARLAWQVVDTV